MAQAGRMVAGAAILPFILFFAVAVYAQDKPTLSEEEWYGDIKRELVGHYTGKRVRVKMVIPATRRGVQVIDGAFRNGDIQATQPVAARPGDELIIKSFRVRDNEIEVMLGKIEPSSRGFLSDLFSPDKNPRIHLRFSYELTARDLKVENIDRMLDLIVDLETFDRQVAEKDGTAIPGGPGGFVSPRAEVSRGVEKPFDGKGPPPAEIIEDLPELGSDVGELTIECSTLDARVYIDGSYSGLAPRVVRLRAGIHMIMVVSNGYDPWERKLLVPAAKGSLVRADLRRTIR